MYVNGGRKTHNLLHVNAGTREESISEPLTVAVVEPAIVRYVRHWWYRVVRALHVVVCRHHCSHVCTAIPCMHVSIHGILPGKIRGKRGVPSMMDDMLMGVIPNSFNFAF